MHSICVTAALSINMFTLLLLCMCVCRRRNESAFSHHPQHRWHRVASRQDAAGAQSTRSGPRHSHRGLCGSRQCSPQYVACVCVHSDLLLCTFKINVLLRIIAVVVTTSIIVTLCVAVQSGIRPS